MPIDDDEKTPVDGHGPIWEMHPELPKIEVPLVAENGNNQRTLESILETVEKVLVSSRTIQEHGQRCADTALEAVRQIPVLQARMNRVEVVAIGATLVNIVMLFVASCLHH